MLWGAPREQGDDGEPANPMDPECDVPVYRAPQEPTEPGNELHGTDDREQDFPANLGTATTRNDCWSAALDAGVAAVSAFVVPLGTRPTSVSSDIASPLWLKTMLPRTSHCSGLHRAGRPWPPGWQRKAPDKKEH